MAHEVCSLDAISDGHASSMQQSSGALVRLKELHFIAGLLHLFVQQG